jgi:hypothetical protein
VWLACVDVTFVICDVCACVFVHARLFAIVFVFVYVFVCLFVCVFICWRDFVDLHGCACLLPPFA